MELKFCNSKSFNISVNVLIVPLWNWNEQLKKFYLVLVSFNRTFMELKFDTQEHGIIMGMF